MQFWTNLQTIYETTLARNKELEGLENEVALLSDFPVRELERRGWIMRKKEKTEKVRVLREFFGIAALRDCERVNAVAFRVTGRRDYSPNALAAWLRKGQLDAAQIDTNPYDRDRFADVVKQIREYTCKSPREFWPEMKKVCASAGVVLVATPELPRSGANGVARWLTPEKALVQLSLKWRWADVFWFTFFHEAAHVLRHKRAGFVHVGTNDIDSPDEQEADRFAADILIPPNSWDGFVNARMFDETSVCGLASRIGVDVGIVVGRLHHEKLLPYNRLSHLKKRFVWNEAAI